MPGAADAGRKALLASRQNFIFSVPMLWFMVGTSHFYVSVGFAGELSSGKVAGFLIISLADHRRARAQRPRRARHQGRAQANLWPYESHKNAIISAFVLWAIFWLLSELFFAA